MKKIEQAIHTIHYLDTVSAQKKWINAIHPLAKLTVTISYVFLLVSFGKYELFGTAGMGVYCLVMFAVSKASLKRGLSQLKYMLLLVCAVGLANPILDRSAVLSIGSLVLTGGFISMITLMLKGIFAVLASYLLIFTTSMEQICHALRLLHVPGAVVTALLLIYRYIVVLLKEAQRIWTAYEMRAPGQKGIRIKAWGPLVGQLLLRSMDRAQTVYDSMLLRGYNGTFSGNSFASKKIESVMYTLVWVCILLLWRYGMFG